MRLTGKNFQPWGDFSLDIEGLTLIVGDSNKGKSSIFRALRGVLRNDLPAEFVRDDQDGRMEVSLDIEGTPTIKATRTRKGNTKYEVGDKKYASLGSKVPEPMETLKFNEVRIGEASIDPIFSEQNKAQFLIDPDRYKPGELNAILGAFSSTDKLDGGKKEANLRITQRNGEARTLAEEIREAEERKELLASLSEKLAKESSLVNGHESRVNHIEEETGCIHEATQRMHRLESLKGIIHRFSLPDTSEAATLEKKSGYLFQAVVRLIRHRLLTDMGLSIDNTLVKWESVANTYKQQRAVAALLGTVSKLAELKRIIREFSLPDMSESAILEKKTGYLLQAVICLIRHQLLTGIGLSIDSVLARWESTAKAYKRQRGIMSLLDMVSEKRGSPKEYVERLGCALKDLEGRISSASGHLAMDKSVTSAQALKASVTKIGISREMTDEILLGANLEVGRLTIACEEAKAAEKVKEGPKCSQCGTALVCPACGK